MVWHDDANIRKRGGDQAEALFAQQVQCFCGGHFQPIGHLRAGFPDFTCDNCGQLVEVKSSPQAEQTGNIAVSAIPWERYPDDVILAIQIKGHWIGQYKGRLQTVGDESYAPAHHGAVTALKDTRFHLIAWKPFLSLADLGFRVQE